MEACRVVDVARPVCGRCPAGARPVPGARCRCPVLSVRPVPGAEVFRCPGIVDGDERFQGEKIRSGEIVVKLM